MSALSCQLSPILLAPSIRWMRGVLVAAMLGLAACGGGKDPTLQSIVVSPAAPTLNVGGTQTFTATGNNKDGYTVGAGLEYMFAPNWSAKAEYQYYNFGSTTFTSGPADIVGVRGREDEHTVKVGVNYRFGWGGPAASRY